MKLIEYAGGLREDNKSIQVKRFVDDKEKIIDIPYKELKKIKKMIFYPVKWWCSDY